MAEWCSGVGGDGCLVAIAGIAAAGNLDDIGITALRNADPTLTGSGIAVIQAEANYGGTDQLPSQSGRGHLSPSQFTYMSGSGVILNSASYTTPNAAGWSPGMRMTWP